MLNPRLIPILLIDSSLHLVKTSGFESRHYLGDPINAAYVFSGFEADELMVLDIDATLQGRLIPLPFVEALAHYTKVPLSIGGGITSLDQIQRLVSLGVEKVVISAVLKHNFRFLEKAVDRFGSSTISVIINSRTQGPEPPIGWFGLPETAGSASGRPLVDLALSCQQAGAGELVIHAADRDGLCQGFAVSLMAELNHQLSIPLVALGGCGNHNHISDLLQASPVSGVAAGSLFVYAPNSSQVLLNYPNSYRWFHQYLSRTTENWQ